MRFSNLLSYRSFSALILSGPWLASATPVAMLDVPQLVATSDAVVVGEIASVQRTGRGSVTIGEQVIGTVELHAELTVYRVIKGPRGLASITFAFNLPDQPVGFQSLSRGDTGTFFLREVSGHYYVNDPHYPRIPGVKQCASSESEPALESVTAELRCALTGVPAPEATQIGAVEALDSIRIDPATEALKFAAHSASMPVRLRAVAALLGRNNISELESVKDILLQPVTDSLRNPVDRLASGLWHGVRTVEAISILERLVGAPDFKVRRGAAQALRSTGSSRAIPGLAQALNDNMREVRYIAVIGLGEITRQNEWSPSVDNFYEHEAHFLGYWRNWVKSYQ